MRRARGFTLIELLVALLIMAVMAGLAWRGLDAVARDRDAARQRVTDADRLSLALRQLDLDLASATDAGPAYPAISMAGNGDLLIVRRAAPAAQLDPSISSASALLQVARWGLRGTTWLRWVGAPTGDAHALAAQMQAADGSGVAMLAPVRGVRYLVYRLAGADQPQGSGAWVNPYSASGVQATDPRAAMLRSPAGLRVSLDSDIPGLRGTVSRDMLLENSE